MPLHAFADESKARGLVVVAVLADSSTLAACRTSMRSLLLPNQQRLHMSKERPARQRQIRNAVTALPVRAWVYRCGTAHEPTARATILRAMVADLCHASVRRLVLEQDDSLVRRDREVLYRSVRDVDKGDELGYLHLRPHQEPMLWIPDAVAWCWAAGGSERAHLASLVERVRHL